MDMDVGDLISRQISLIAQSNSSRLGFPAIITALCMDRGVTSDSLTFETLSLANNLAYIKKNCWNLDDPSVSFPGTCKARARGSEGPSSSAPQDSTDAILPRKGPVTRAMSKRLQEDWARVAKEGPRVLINLRVDF